MSLPIKLENLRDLVSMGAVKTATILGQKGGFAVMASLGVQKRVLTNKMGAVRMFATTDTAIRELHRLGLSMFTVDVSNYEKGRVRARRPDVAAKAKEAAAALAHDQWFRAQVDEALAEEAEGKATWHAHDEVWASLEAETAKLVRKRESQVIPDKTAPKKQQVQKRKAKAAPRSAPKKRA
jgi:hypothetical protein